MESIATSSVISSELDDNVKHDNSGSSSLVSNKKTNQRQVSKTEGSNKSDSSKSYKEKISSHFQSVKQKTIRNHNLKASKLKFSTGTGKQKKSLKHKIKSIKNTHKTFDNNYSTETFNFFCGSNEVKEVNNTISENIHSPSEENKQPIILYSLPELETFHMKLSEKDVLNLNWQFACFYKNNIEVHILEQGLYVNKNRNIKYRDINILEQRLSATEEKKWFTSSNNLEILENPLTEASIRPSQEKRHKVCYYSTPSLQDKCKEVVIVRENILEIYMTELKFTHHPLFSLEHVFAEKLCNLYNQYTDFIKSNNTERLKNQLEALRYLRKNVENKTMNDCTLTRIVYLDKDIQKLRKIYFEQGKKERENLKDILNTWKQIKKIREKQNFSNTNVKLIIKKEVVDYESDNSRYNKIYQETLQELIRETKNELTENLEQNTNVAVDESDIEKNLQNLFQQSFRPVGEPVLKLILSNNNEITTGLESSKEVARRNAVKYTKIYLNILCNNITVCKSKSLALNDNFLLDIKESFSIQLQDVPKCLKIEVIEQMKGLIKKKICEVSIPVPTQNFSISNKPMKTSFETNEIVHYKHNGIGSGVDLKTVLESTDLTFHDSSCNLKTSGYIEYCIGWQNATSLNKDCLGEQIKLLRDVTNKDLAINTDKFSEWMLQTTPDPQDPGNAVFFEYMSSYDPKIFKNNSSFRLNPHLEDFKFCNVIEIEQNIRFKILRLRNHNTLEFDGVVVPNRIKEIPLDTMENLKNYRYDENEDLSQEDIEDQIEAQRSYGRKYLKQIQVKLFQICKNSKNNLVYESVVDEKYLVHFEAMVKYFIKSIMNWFYWQPKNQLLSRTRTQEKRPQFQEKINEQQYNVIIKILSAKNVPSRNMNKSKGSLEDQSTEKYTEKDKDVKPFVEISYGNISIRTKSSDGVNPSWNEVLTLPLEYQNVDYLNPESLNGTILVNLYDECDSLSKHQNKVSYYWLGAVEVPLSAVCYSENMCGLFKVKLPQLLLGYEVEADKHISKSPKSNNPHSLSNSTYIQMELTIQPNVPKLNIAMESLPCGDVPYIHQHAMRWNESYNNSFPNRKFYVLAIDSNAKTICITRYIKPLEPPQINLEEFDVTPEQCMRYVSLIPFTECNQFYNNVWLSTNELLRFMIGSITDHAVTLTCYLLALKMDAWLLLGFGIPHGSTAYVLVREFVNDETPTYNIYDVVYNEKYNLTDQLCPLQRIYCLVNGENVWANIQRNDNVHNTRFELNRRSDWLPLFNNNISAPTNYINKRIIYNSSSKVERLETQIEIRIKKKITKLRQLNRTVWNHNLKADLKNVLRSFEINSMYNKNHYEITSEINEKLASYAVTGYVLNTAYINTSTIIKNIQKLGICYQETDRNEFILAVYIHSYSGPLLSLWILIGSIIKKVDV